MLSFLLPRRSASVSVSRTGSVATSAQILKIKLLFSCCQSTFITPFVLLWDPSRYKLPLALVLRRTLHLPAVCTFYLRRSSFAAPELFSFLSSPPPPAAVSQSSRRTPGGRDASAVLARTRNVAVAPIAAAAAAATVAPVVPLPAPPSVSQTSSGQDAPARLSRFAFYLDRERSSAVF